MFGGRVAAAVMKQAHSEGVATREQAIVAIEKDLGSYGDDTDQDGDARDGEKEGGDKQVRRASPWNVAHTSGRSRSTAEHLDHNLPS